MENLKKDEFFLIFHLIIINLSTTILSREEMCVFKSLVC